MGEMYDLSTFGFFVDYPTQAQVQVGVTFGHIYTGTYVGSADYPGVGNVRDGISYADGTLTGTLELPSVNDVELGVQFGEDGTEFTGVFVVPLENTVKFGTFYGASQEFVGTYRIDASTALYIEPVTVQDKVFVTDSYGRKSYTWSTILTDYECRFRQLSGKDSIIDIGGNQTILDYKVYGDYESTINRNCKIIRANGEELLVLAVYRIRGAANTVHHLEIMVQREK